MVVVRLDEYGNPLWGAPGIHGELLKLGIEISQATVAKYRALQRQFAAGRFSRASSG